MIELPDEVVSLLQFIGVNWPNVNEDKVRELASHVREFAENLDNTHQESTATIKRLGDSYQGASYEALLAKWARLSNSHMSELIEACHQAVAVATLGIAEAAEVLIVKATEERMDFLEQQLEQYIIGQVIEAAVDPLVEVVGRAVTGLVFQSAESALGVSASGGAGSVGEGFSIHPEAVHAHAELMNGHAETVASHAEAFRTKLATVSFE